VSGFIIRAGGQTNQGIRENNEDRFAIDEERRIQVVADGLGGRSGGARAAEIAVEVISREIGARLDQGGEASEVVQRALTEANRAVLELCNELGMGRGAGAAVVVAFWRGDQVVISWLGDCRAYRLSEGKVNRLTEDHTVRRALIRSGTITEEQASASPIRHVLYRYLGCPELPDPFECRSYRPQREDRFILATDGLYPFLEGGELLAACRAHPDPQECANHLVELALARGSRDNITGVVLAFEPLHFHPGWLAWNGGMVGQLVRMIEQENAFHLLPVLGDALEEAGCTNTDILEHCHRPGAHGRACWVLGILSRHLGAADR
jgi:protein phosphatase